MRHGTARRHRRRGRRNRIACLRCFQTSIFGTDATGAAAGHASREPDRAAHGRDASIPLLRDENPCLW
jgi:hypothetical protein